MIDRPASRALVVVRPEPGNAATAGRARGLGFNVIQRPLFVIEPLVWTPPDPHRFDALLVTSANAIRHAGEGLAAIAALPVVAVGAASAVAARTAGLRVVATGDSDADAAIDVAKAIGLTRLLHLAGRDRHDVGLPVAIVYAGVERPAPPDMTRDWIDRIVLLHSARAARRVALLVDRDGTDRAAVALAAISAAALAAAGPGWRAAVSAPVPTDAALFDVVRERLTDRRAPGISTT